MRNSHLRGCLLKRQDFASENSRTLLNVTTHLKNQFMYNVLALKEKGWTNMQSTAREVLTGTGMCLFMWSRGREIAVANSQAYQKPQAPLNSIFILFSPFLSRSLSFAPWPGE